MLNHLGSMSVHPSDDLDKGWCRHLMSEGIDRGFMCCVGFHWAILVNRHTVCLKDCLLLAIWCQVFLFHCIHCICTIVLIHCTYRIVCQKPVGRT